MFCHGQSCFIRSRTGLNVIKIQTRWKTKKDHWAVLARTKKSTDRALEYFDDFYKKVFDKQWPSIRLGLLSENKYCAVINNYSDTERIELELETLGAINIRSLIKAQMSHKDAKMWQKNLDKVKKMDSDITNNTVLDDDVSPTLSSDYAVAEPQSSERLILPSDAGSMEGSPLYDFIPATRLRGMEDYVPESHHYSYYDSGTGSNFSPQIEVEDRLAFPDPLKVYTFESGNISRFPKPKRGSTGVMDYYLLDGSSVLPVLCLGLEPGDRVLDMCSAPGGKSLLCLQTLAPGKVVSNDSSLSRLNRLKCVFNDYFYDLPRMVSEEQVVISNFDARELSHLGQFNKILVDVLCTADRHSVKEDDNNIFKPDRVKERIKLPELQADILTSALKQVEDGGTVVYATCSLSPVQNDGVVHMALRRIWEETNDNLIIKDLSRVLKPYNALYKFGENIGLRYGHLIIPYLPSNFGPMYFCKLIKRNKV